ncbi:MAG: tetratricopeptide repeat protein [Polaribacter sp.]|jgi:signal transduction histidine kinase|tara:strand:- start:359 stop:2197 length:1839 start_codon:yes stop_codon:yes gene_type:complete
MKRYVKVALFLLATISIGSHKIIANSEGETRLVQVSPSLFNQNMDSVFTRKYQEVQKYFDNEEYSKSLELGLILFSEFEITSNISLRYLSGFILGENFSKINDHEKAIFYFKKALFLLQDELLLDGPVVSAFKGVHKNHYFLADNLLKIGIEYSRLKKKDSAISYYNKIIQMDFLDDDLLSLKAATYNNLSATYIGIGSYDLAKKYALQAVEIRRLHKNTLNEASALTNLASIYMLEDNHKEAKKIYLKALGLLAEDTSSAAVRYKEDIYYNLAWALYNLKDFTSYDYQEKSYLIKDSLRNVEFEHIVQQVYEKYQFDIARKQASSAASEVTLKKLEEKKTILYSLILIISVIISAGFIVYNYKLRQKNLKLKLAQTRLAQNNKLEKLKSEAQVRILNATLDGKETERKQIAETLHDSVSSLLSSANLHLQASKIQFKGVSPPEIDKTQMIITEAAQTIRNLSHYLVSSVLLKFGLKYAIKEMSEKYSNSQLQINTDIKNLRRYHQSFEIKANNIIQECVNNILKHSKASTALVKLEEKSGSLHIHVQDDGEGFDETLISSKDGLGINQIHARIQMMQGTFLIKSAVGKGTTIFAALPIMEKNELTHAVPTL